MKTSPISILQVPLEEAGVSGRLAEAAKSHGYHTLAELFRMPVAELVEADWITPQIWTQLLRLAVAMPPTDRDTLETEDTEPTPDL
ncbi:MAG: hypothetical protein JO301_10425 [Chitinophagaceae bacterium]|nr:hypothetical protein [Chitinophagaceae bacterium]